MLSVFDLDGTLVDTREANLLAYLEVGVTPPDNFHQIPWETWCPQEAHNAKGATLENYAHLVRPLPLLSVMMESRAENRGVVVSSTSRAALNLVRRVVPELATVSIHYGVRDRLRTLAMLAARHGSGVYYDDSYETCQEVRRRTKWQTCWIVQ